MRDMKTTKTPVMTKKIKFQFNQMTFELPSNSIQTDRWDNTQFIYMGAKNTASVIKQYVKQKYGNRITVWASSNVYSGGSSVRINVCSKNGSVTPYEIYEDINSFAKSFKAGSFDGMSDSYDFRDDEVKSDNGTQFKYFPSYVFVENRPQYGTLEYYLYEWKKFDPSDYTCKMIGDTTWEQFVNFYSRGMKKGMLDKLVTYMVKLEKELKDLGYTNEELMEVA
jgi:hypothetical protein